jgi:hypothetical protein
MALFKSIKTKMAPYFLEEAGPFSKKANYKATNIKRAGLGLIFILILVLLFSGEDPRKTNSGVVPSFQIQNQAAQAEGKSQSSQTSKSGAGGSFGSALGSGGIGYGNSRASAPPSRNHSANQVIRRGANGTDPDSQLPMGYSISVKLINAIYSTNTGSPVVAEVTSDVSGHTGVSIPEHTHVIGEASFDESAQRIKVRFHTFVYPEGDQHSVQGLGLMADGSAGLDGDYHSGNGTRQLGRFLGTFVSGMADGMIERQSGGMFGSPYETASVRNGVLNGVTLSAQDQTKMVTDQLSQVKPSMSLPAGTQFLLYLEKEYSP